MQIKKEIKIIIVSLFFILFFIFPSSTKALTISPPRVELEGVPGTTITGRMKILNEEDDKTFYSSFENFEAKGETGIPSFKESKEDLAGWFNVDSSITLKKGEEIIIPFSINIPKNAEPGGHFAAIFWNTTPPSDAQVAVGAKVGMLVLLKVAGEVKEQAGIIEFSTNNHRKFFTSLPIDFYYRFQNSGNDRAKPNGDLKIKNIFGFVSKKINANLTEGNVLPNSIRRFTISWGDNVIESQDVTHNLLQRYITGVKNEWHNFAFGRYKANLDLIYGSGKIPTTASVTFWVFPWHLLLIIIILLFIIIILGKKEVAGYNRWVISKAMKNIKNAHQSIKSIGKKNRI